LRGKTKTNLKPTPTGGGKKKGLHISGKRENRVRKGEGGNQKRIQGYSWTRRVKDLGGARHPRGSTKRRANNPGMVSLRRWKKKKKKKTKGEKGGPTKKRLGHSKSGPNRNKNREKNPELVVKRKKKGPAGEILKEKGKLIERSCEGEWWTNKVCKNNRGTKVKKNVRRKKGFYQVVRTPAFRKRKTRGKPGTGKTWEKALGASIKHSSKGRS